MINKECKCDSCLHIGVCEWAISSDIPFNCDDYIAKTLIDELCNDYCRSCILIYKSSGCADCSCAHVRELLKDADNDKSV